jgi:hypothetical protein
MKYLKTFEGLSSFLKKIRLSKSKYLITYNVTNYKASKEEWESGRYSSKWNSKDYEYLISANSEEEAKDKFKSLWNEEVEFCEPEPILNIIYVTLLNDKDSIGSFEYKIKIS